MKTVPIAFRFRRLASAALGLACSVPLLADETPPGVYPDPARFEPEIAAFEAADAEAMPPEGAVVFAGSSSFRHWRERIAEDMAPLTVVARGFGGSNLRDLNAFADRIVFKYKPRAIVVYEGDNDIGAGIDPQTVAQEFAAFVAAAKERLPEVRIYFVSIKPSMARWHLWTKMQEANDLIARQCVADGRLAFIDVSSVMLDPDGKPDPSIFIEDGLHMNRDGYLRWKDVLQRELVAKERQFEK